MRRVERVQHYDYLKMLVPDEAGDPVAKYSKPWVEWMPLPPLVPAAEVVFVLSDVRLVLACFVNFLHCIEQLGRYVSMVGHTSTTVNAISVGVGGSVCSEEVVDCILLTA